VSAKPKRARSAPRATGATRSPAAPRVTFAPLTIERWADFERLFGPRGGCAGCWCMYPFTRGREMQQGAGEVNRAKFRRIVATGAEPGILAYVGGEPAGWCAFAPRERYPRLAHSRILEPVDDRPVWSVMCFFVAREHRGHGLSVRLLDAAARHARRRGARVLEGYPVAPSGTLPAAFAWHGTAAAFEAAGFTEVARPSASRRVMRRELRGRG
jgi:GNAT superfamily N-acetyltransferase